LLIVFKIEENIDESSLTDEWTKKLVLRSTHCKAKQSTHTQKSDWNFSTIKMALEDAEASVSLYSSFCQLITMKKYVKLKVTYCWIYLKAKFLVSSFILSSILPENFMSLKKNSAFEILWDENQKVNFNRNELNKLLVHVSWLIIFNSVSIHFNYFNCYWQICSWPTYKTDKLVLSIALLLAYEKCQND
jgi:hypothetical protein